MQRVTKTPQVQREKWFLFEAQFRKSISPQLVLNLAGDIVESCPVSDGQLLMAKVL